MIMRRILKCKNLLVNGRGNAGVTPSIDKSTGRGRTAGFVAPTVASASLDSDLRRGNSKKDKKRARVAARERVLVDAPDLNDVVDDTSGFVYVDDTHELLSKDKDKPIVFITPEAKQKLDLYIECCSDEISGLGSVITLPSGGFLINEIHLFEQEVTGASTDLNSEDISKFLLQSINLGVNPETLKLWWHSHVNMGAFWSGTDDSTVNLFNNGWMISIVGNKRGEYKVRLDLYEPFRLTLDNLKYGIHHSEDSEMKTAIEAEIAAKVTKKAYTYPIYGGAYGQGNYWQQKDWWKTKLQPTTSKDGKVTSHHERSGIHDLSGDKPDEDADSFYYFP